MVSWLVTYSYSNNEQIRVSDVDLMNAIYGSSGLFWSLVRSNKNIYNIYTAINSILSSEPTSIHGPVRKFDLNYSFSRIHFSRIPQEADNFLTNRLYHTVSYTPTNIYPVINEFSPNEVKRHLHICDQSIVTFGIRGFCFSVSNTYFLQRE